MNQLSYELTVKQLQEAIKAGQEVTVIINGEFYDLKGVENAVFYSK